MSKNAKVSGSVVAGFPSPAEQYQETLGTRFARLDCFPTGRDCDDSKGWPDMFYGNKHSDLKPANREYAFVGSLGGLYRMLLGCWRRETCAPRMQEKWSASNPTCGQCSITAFLVQDIFGGEVYGVPNGDGNYHCFNAVGDAVFDLTSEQFDHPLAYTMDFPQSRETHFAKTEKKLRYEALKLALMKHHGSDSGCPARAFNNNNTVLYSKSPCDA